MRHLLALALLVSLTGCAAFTERTSGALEGWRDAAKLAGLEVDDLKAVLRVAVAIGKLARDVENPDTMPEPKALIATAQGINFPVICHPTIADECARVVEAESVQIRRGSQVPCPETHRIVEGKQYSVCLFVESFRSR
jgi:hypothetical protein